MILQILQCQEWQVLMHICVLEAKKLQEHNMKNYLKECRNYIKCKIKTEKHAKINKSLLRTSYRTTKATPIAKTK